MWDETNHADAGWLTNEAAFHWHHLAEWSQAEPLLRRALVIVEQSFGPEHPDVAIDLNNLAQLLKATNRLAEAEPLMRRCVGIFYTFKTDTGYEHPSARAARGNLGAIQFKKAGCGRVFLFVLVVLLAWITWRWFR